MQSFRSRGQLAALRDGEDYYATSSRPHTSLLKNFVGSLPCNFFMHTVTSDGDVQAHPTKLIQQDDDPFATHGIPIFNLTIKEFYLHEGIVCTKEW